MHEGFKLIVRHPETGQRVQVCEEHFDEPDHHPLNQDHTDHSTGFLNPDGTAGATSFHQGRRGSQRKSLKAEGWEPVAMVETETNLETPLPKGYAWKAPKKGGD